jgi:hypothetical protein
LRKRLLALPIAALGLGLLGAAPAYAHDHGAAATGQPTPSSAPAESAAPGTPHDFNPLFLTANLSGAQEVPVAGGPAVGDADGEASALVKVQGARVTFSFSWSGITAPTLGHIHEGIAGVNGPVKVGLFTEPMPATATAAAGAVTVTDAKIAAAIRANPAGFYVNLHTAAFPGGAVRGQLKALGGRADLLRIVRPAPRRAFLSGDQEVPVAGGPAVGDPDGRAIGFLRTRSAGVVNYSLAWVGVAPTLGHVHQGKVGTNGAVVVPLFTEKVPSTIFAMSGRVSDVDAALIGKIRRTPTDFYLNLHTADFPGGAVRGQLFR